VPIRVHSRLASEWALVCIALLAGFAVRADDLCAICGNAFTDKVYIFTDHVTDEKTRVCTDCATSKEFCFICGLPVKKESTHLPDGRYICARDIRTAVLNEDEARQVCAEVRDALDHFLSRFMTFPGTNLTTAVVDRVHLLELFKMPGRDFDCPNVLGYISSKTKRGVMRHSMSLLGALPRAELKAVCAHELTHAWQAENVPTARKKTLGHDAIEAFCELIAYKLMDSQSETDQMKAICRNAYTRGQIDLFIAADQRFGFDQIMDWMKYGVDAVLHADDLNNVRNVELPRATPRISGVLPSVPVYGPRTYNTLMLKSIVWSKEHPMAIINDRTFERGNSFKVQLGTNKVAVTCISIQEDAVRIKVAGSAEEQELRLRAK
jgi:hypothetical protein